MAEQVVRLRRCLGTQRNTFFYHIGDGYHYHRNAGVWARKVYLKCVLYERGCLGRAVYHGATRTFRSTQPHTHEADPHYVQEMNLRRRILRRCRNLEFVTFRRIVNEERRRYPLAVKQRVSLARMRSAMQRERQAMYPAPPDSLRGLSEILRQQRFQVLTMTSDGADSLYAASVTAHDGSHNVILASRRMLDFGMTLRTLFADGTFKTTPAIPNIAQVFTIIGNWRHTIIPIAWVLMERKTEAGYTNVLRALRLLMGGARNLHHVVTDFERGQQNAWQTVFGQRRRLRLQGCFWHLLRAFVRYIKNVLRLGHLLRQPVTRGLFKRLCALPLLPLQYQLRGFGIILREAFAAGRRVYRSLRAFFSYVWRRWVNHPLRRLWMCVYGSQHRTNNSCESHNRMLLNYIGGAHPSVFNFLAAIISMEDNAYTDVAILRGGGNPSRRRKASAYANDRTLQNLAEDLRHPPGRLNDAINIFLHRAAYTFAGAFEDAVEHA